MGGRRHSACSTCRRGRTTPRRSACASEGVADPIRGDRPLLHGTSTRAATRLLRPVKVRRFDPADDLIIVRVRLYGPRGHRPVSLAFDTAASETHIVPE